MTDAILSGGSNEPQGVSDQKETTSNSQADLKRRASRLSRLLDEIADLQEDVKLLKQSARDDGYSVKALMQVVKEHRKGADYQAKQLELELEIDTYRAAVGLPRTLDDAQKAVVEAASHLDDGEDEAEA